MSLVDARRAIESYFKAQWKGRTPVVYDNTPFTPPNPPRSWVRLAFVAQPSVRASIGPDPLVRYYELLYVMLFVEQGRGTKELLNLFAIVAGAFQDLILTPTGVNQIVFEPPPYLKEVGPDGIWYQANAICPYRTDVLVLTPPPALLHTATARR